MIFFEKFENRIKFWQSFRQGLENDLDPIKRTIDFWNTAPISSMSCDPYDNKTWPRAWQLIDENNYCDFSKILAIYYTLSLTDRFKDSYFEIQVASDQNEHRVYFILIMDDLVVGYDYNRAILRAELPNLWIHQSHIMSTHLE